MATRHPRFRFLICKGILILWLFQSPMVAADDSSLRMAQVPPNVSVDNGGAASSDQFMFEVCNQGCAPASVAVSYYSDDKSSWMTQGWWTVPGNQCKSLGSFKKGEFYYYAKGFYSDALEWHGDFGLCVRLPGPFLTVNNGACPRPGISKRFTHNAVQTAKFSWNIQGPCE